MKIEIITIGDEILIGQIVDTNSAWMAQELTSQGYEITAITSVGDDAAMITDALDIAFGRADALLLTGGVGPTRDDITKNTLCEYFNTKLVFNEDVLQNIIGIFSRRNIQLNALTRNQAMVPEGCTVIQNAAGTAPILWFNRNDKALVSMPGVPFEMKTAMTNEIIPRLLRKFPTDYYRKRSFLVAGISESGLAMRLQDFEDELPEGLRLAYLPSFGMIRLRLSVRGKTATDEELGRQADKLKTAIKEYLIAEGDASLEELLGEKLREKRLTASTAESCTGGYIAHRITRISGASDYFIGSIVSYANSIKENVLHVNSEVINELGAVSEQVVEQMAEGVASLLKTDCSIAVSGIAGPTGGTDEKPVGTVWICTRFGQKSVAKKYNFGKNREENIARTANMAMLQLLEMLMQPRVNAFKFSINGVKICHPNRLLAFL